MGQGMYVRSEYENTNNYFPFVEIVKLVSSCPEGLAVIDGFGKSGLVAFPEKEKVRDSNTCYGYYLVTQDEAVVLILTDEVETNNVFMLTDDNPVYLSIKKWINEYPDEVRAYLDDNHE